IDVRKLKFLDESGSNLAMAREYARSLRGERAVGSVPHTRGKQTTIVGVLGITGILCCQAFQGAMNEGTMLYYIKHVLAKVWDPEDILVMDNLTSHKTPLVLKTLEECKIKYMFL